MSKVKVIVFADDFKLKNLKDVEDIFKEHMHPPEIQVQKKWKNKALIWQRRINYFCKKVEELTLYTIEQEEKLKELKMIVETILNNRPRKRYNF